MIAAKSKQRKILTKNTEESKQDDEEYLVSFIQRSAFTKSMGQQIVQLLSKFTINPNHIDESTGLTVIMKCIISRNLTALKILLENIPTIDLNLKADSGEFEGMTPLHL